MCVMHMRVNKILILLLNKIIIIPILTFDILSFFHKNLHHILLGIVSWECHTLKESHHPLTICALPIIWDNS